MVKLLVYIVKGMLIVVDEAADRRGIQEQRERHVGRLLLQAHRTFSDRAVEKLRSCGYSGVTLAHIGLLPHIDVDGTRITTLAERGGMTKQGIGQLVRSLEELGYLERAPDPADGRATLVRFTTSGQRFLRDALAVTREVESEFAAILGNDQLETLRAALAEIVRRPH
jgi:DNA-binding MarR family transcriptional regulator